MASVAYPFTTKKMCSDYWNAIRMKTIVFLDCYLGHTIPNNYLSVHVYRRFSSIYLSKTHHELLDHTEKINVFSISHSFLESSSLYGTSLFHTLLIFNALFHCHFSAFNASTLNFRKGFAKICCIYLLSLPQLTCTLSALL